MISRRPCFSASPTARLKLAPLAALLAAVGLAALLAAVALAAGCGATGPAGSSGGKPASAAAPINAPALSPTAAASSSPSSGASPSATSVTPPRFAYSVATLSHARRAAMIRSGAWSPRCPVSLDDLRLLTLSYWGFDGRDHVGRLVVNRDAVAAVASAMGHLYRARFPIRRMVTVEAYGANDERSMRADNTSAFNGRFVMGSTVWSQHAYGRAIDVDPLENPEIDRGLVYPSNAARYVDRTLGLPGMIAPGGLVVRAFAAVGWGWGGAWRSPKDYQHFSATGT